MIEQMNTVRGRKFAERVCGGKPGDALIRKRKADLQKGFRASLFEWWHGDSGWRAAV